VGFSVYEKWIYGFFCFTLVEDFVCWKKFVGRNENDQKIKMMINRF